MFPDGHGHDPLLLLDARGRERGLGNRDQALSRCEGCGRSYAYRSSLYRHIKYECGKPPQFQCPYCPRKTKQKLNLKEHIRMLHPGQPNPF